MESRHAFQNNKEVALQLFGIYFGDEQRDKLTHSDYLWNDRTGNKIKTGILGEQSLYLDRQAIDTAITNWIINLAKVGFHVCQ